MSAATAYIGLGSNLGDRRALLSRALEMLEAKARLSVTAVSPLYETEPVGGPRQGPYLNACAALSTSLPPVVLLREMLALEDALGRTRRQRWGPRTVDLDLLLYEDLVLCTPSLELPHPRMTQRDFVLVPLAAIAPDLKIPPLGKTVSELLRERGEPRGVTLLEENWR